MKTDKKKIVFIGGMALILLFIAGYYLMVLQGDGPGDGPLREAPLPELSEGDIPVFESKKQAIDAIEEDRERTAPSPYDDRLLDSLGRYDPDLLQKDKRRIVDSIYRQGGIDYSDDGYTARIVPVEPAVPAVVIDSAPVGIPDTIAVERTSLKAMALEQQLFFAVAPQLGAQDGETALEVTVDGAQRVAANDRVRLRAVTGGTIAGITVPKGTLLYGTVALRPNRTMLDISRIAGQKVGLVAIDAADRLEGIYIRNSYREEAATEVIGDIVEDINIPGVPQVGGLKKVFRRNQRKVRVTVPANYRLLLIAK